MNNEIPQEAVEQMKKEGWATPVEQMAYWEKDDHGGNVLEDRIEANLERFSYIEQQAIEDGKVDRRIDEHEDNFDGPEFQTLGEYETDSERNA